MNDTYASKTDARGGTILYTAAEIKYGINYVAHQLDARLSNGTRDNVDFVVVLNGGKFFANRLLPQLWGKNNGDKYGRVQTIKISTYGSKQESSRELKIDKELDHPVAARKVVVLEDLLDTGFTVSELKKLLLEREASQVIVAALVNKPALRIKKNDETPVIKPDIWAVQYDGVHWLYGCGMNIGDDESTRDHTDIWKVPPITKHF